MRRIEPAERPYESVARILREDILSGRYRSGERLPIERELSERFEVSRSVIRQALLILDQQGLVRVRSGVGGGPFVAHETLPAAIAAFENLLAVDASSLEEFLRAKHALEPVMNAMAAESIPDEQIALLEANIVRTREAISRGEPTLDHLIEFHSILANSTGNRFVALIVELMSRAMSVMQNTSGLAQLDADRAVDEHAEMVEALRDHDTDRVHELTRTHLAEIWGHEIGGVAPASAAT
jgi:DNA-binding FadR family transcriptional regulator